MTTTTATEREKLHEVALYSQKIGEFMEWLQYEKGVVLGTHHVHSEGCKDKEGDRVCGYRQLDLCLFHPSIQSLLAEFFDIDMVKVEEERRAILSNLRKETK